jgi:HEAT repeat protein
MKLKALAPHVLATFKATKPSTKEGAYFRDVNEALLAVADPAWAAELTAMLDVDFPSMKEKNPEVVSEYKDKLYQTVTAVQILGETGAASAVPALMKAFLDPFKQDAGNEILLALTKIGKPSADEAIKLLQNKSPELAEYHRKQLQKQTGAERPPDGNPHVQRAAMALGVIGRKEGIAPLIDAISTTKEDGLRTQMLISLAMLPHTPEVKAAFLQGIKTMPNDAEFNGGNAIQALCEPSTLFFDSSFVEALLAKGEKLKKTDVLPRALLALASMKVMDESQIPAVTKFIQSIGKAEGGLASVLDNVNRGLQQTSGLLTACKKDAACYLAAAAKTENQSSKTQLIGMKGLYMYGIIAGPEGTKALLGKLSSFEEGALRYAVSQVIDHHNPNGSVDVAKQIDAVIQPRADSPDRDKAAVDKPLRDLTYRLRARAQ